jgi:hypothetical protein
MESVPAVKSYEGRLLYKLAQANIAYRLHVRHLLTYIDLRRVSLPEFGHSDIFH